LLEDIAFERLVAVAKLRWRIECDYQELKKQLGLVIMRGAASTPCRPLYCRLRLFDRRTRRHPPSGPRFSVPLLGSAIPDGYRPRGAADPTRTAHPQLDRDHPTAPRRHARQDPSEMPLLLYADPEDGKNSRLLTQ
jgi:hypothetical protein